MKESNRTPDSAGRAVSIRSFALAVSCVAEEPVYVSSAICRYAVLYVSYVYVCAHTSFINLLPRQAASASTSSQSLNTPRGVQSTVKAPDLARPDILIPQYIT